LKSVGHPKQDEIKNAKIERLQMPWRTGQNVIDCGLFVMRHMETYKGTEVNNWECGFSNEGLLQRFQINNLRVKYLAKILLHSLNEEREFVCRDTSIYNALDPKIKSKLLETADERVTKRLNAWS